MSKRKIEIEARSSQGGRLCCKLHDLAVMPMQNAMAGANMQESRRS
jgi:hypothetical protein